MINKDDEDKDDDAQQGGVGGVSGLMNRPRAVRHLVEAPLIYTGCEHCNIVADAHIAVLCFSGCTFVNIIRHNV